MSGLTLAIVLPLLAFAAAGLVATGAAIDDHGLVSVVARPFPRNRPPLPPAALLRVELQQVWPIEQAGLVGASAWLTATRETGEYQARAAAIAAAYDKIERRAVRQLRAAGMTKGKGWACG